MRRVVLPSWPERSTPGAKTMAHTRLRAFNTRDVYGPQALDNDVCMVVRAGRTVFLRGQTGFDLDNNFVGIGDPAAQTEQAMANVKVLLGEAGAKLAHICQLHIYLLDRAHRSLVYPVIGRHLKGVFPVMTGLIIAGLAIPEMLVEIDVTAVIPEDEA
jgi:enamine deaminase RidA (YjgF/YER057c/UK114 family)